MWLRHTPVQTRVPFTHRFVYRPLVQYASFDLTAFFFSRDSPLTGILRGRQFRYPSPVLFTFLVWLFRFAHRKYRAMPNFGHYMGAWVHRRRVSFCSVLLPELLFIGVLRPNPVSPYFLQVLTSCVFHPTNFYLLTPLVRNSVYTVPLIIPAGNGPTFVRSS